MQKCIQNFGVMEGRNRYSTPFMKLDLIRQIKVVLDIFGSDHMSRNKAVGNSTKKARAYVVFQFFQDLRENGYLIKNVLNLSQKHVQAIVKVWLDAGIEPSTIQGRMSILKWFTQSIGKADMIRDYASYGIPEDRIQRTYVAKVDKSWVGNEVFTQELIDKVKAKDAWVAMNLELMQQFGLRIRESVLIRPKYSDSSTTLTVEEGTKGGRTRVVPILKQEQREVLDRAIQMSTANVRGAMVHPGKDPKQSIRRIYYVCEILGITKDQLNITPHGLRHEYANDRYEEVSGMPSTVRGSVGVFDREKDEEARNVVTRELGHARLSITAAYTGARVQGRPKS